MVAPHRWRVVGAADAAGHPRPRLATTRTGADGRAMTNYINSSVRPAACGRNTDCGRAAYCARAGRGRTQAKLPPDQVSRYAPSGTGMSCR